MDEKTNALVDIMHSFTDAEPETRTGNGPTKGMEDVASIGADRNWKGIGISLLVILVVLSLIGLSIILLSKVRGDRPVGSQLTLDDLFHENFKIHDPGARWISGEEIIYRSWDGDVLKVNTHSNETELLLKNTTFATFKASKFAVSPDLNFVLLGYDVKQAYQGVITELSLVRSVCRTMLTPLLKEKQKTLKEVRELNPPEVSDSVLQFASWGVHGQQLLYIFENNIYYQTDVHSSSWRLTSSGQEEIVFNGIADWLYEEEVLHTQVAHWWSPAGSRLAYLTINDSLVPNMVLPRFTGSLYPRGKEYPYPKMGQVNPTVRLYVITLDGSSLTTELRPPDSFEKSEYYITMVKWVTQERLSVRWVNRAQNMSILSLCEVTTGDCIKSEGQEVNIRHLTSGSWEVSQILAYDEGNNSVVSTLDPFHKECLTCSLFSSRCTYYEAVLSPNYQHVLLKCRERKTLESNTVLKHALIDRTVPKWERRTVQINNFELRLELTVPVDLDETKEYPLLLVLDSVPGGQAVSDRFFLSWDSVLVSSDSVIVARLDGRGSSFQGQRILHEVHQRLGTVDVQDQITAIEHLIRLPYVDATKVGVYGKAYGGFLSSLLLLSHSSLFKCGIAVAPIANWRLYGSAVTEKYFGFPVKENHKYKVKTIVKGNFCVDCLWQISSLLSNTTAPSSLNFLIIHGTADATVHFQHSAELVKLLSASNINYTLQIFPDEGHSTASVKSQHYLLNSVLNFFRSCFKEEEVVVLRTSDD
ncbi:Inactive dipeptidyl peptidase 10 Dipeptidyl peptidase IV-related protein 3 [Channa argus]|uniref:Inactive dipeptidyl peptidase 10 Dipeptidyl peptidase IV-related protein 3 n=1 Tax=Channa argus TaxID=215402 RepID=A0A6G1PY70_CHAAH|nr:Inactive dipeptidyl peptidase 10 Dipeptidyl peptidase IV-related protein 3 [Channa argus]